MKKQKSTELEVVTIGEPSVESLSEGEQHAFFETLLNRIKTLKAEEEKKSNESDNNENN